MTGYHRKSVINLSVDDLLGLRQVREVTGDDHELRRRHIGRWAVHPVGDLCDLG